MILRGQDIMYLKEKHLCLFFLSVFVSLIIAGPLSAGVSKDDFYAVQIVEKEAWIVGSFGTILNSKDMGESWSVQESGLKESLVDVFFIDHEHGWITGPFGIILYTEDGGLSWRPQKSGVDMMLFDVMFVDSGTGWISGQDGTIIHTVDGGETWEKLPPVMDFDLYSLYFRDKNLGWTGGEFGPVYKTQDGGRNWTKQKNPVEISYLTGSQECIFRIIFNRGAEEGLATYLNGGVLHTKDGGENWNIVPVVNKNHFFNGCPHKDKFWLVGRKGTLAVYDGGKINTVAIGTKRDLVGISFGSDGFGLAVGCYATMLRTLDGKTWTLLKVSLK